MRHRSLLPALLAAALGAGAAGAAGAQQAADDSTFTWKGEVPAGAWLRIRNMIGPVEVLPASGSAVEITAVKRLGHDDHGHDDRERGRLAEVRFEVKQRGNDVMVCALWTDTGVCGDADYQGGQPARRRGGNDVSVRFTVRLPRSVRADVATGNGRIEVADAGAEVVARTGNGRIEVTTAHGPVNASTGNGAIVARMASVAGAGDMEFSTGNGSITIEVPSSFDAELDLRTGNGGIRTDFPITLIGRVNPRHIRATLGRGGRRVSARTGNGSIQLGKR